MATLRIELTILLDALSRLQWMTRDLLGPVFCESLPELRKVMKLRDAEIAQPLKSVNGLVAHRVLGG